MLCKYETTNAKQEKQDLTTFKNLVKNSKQLIVRLGIGTNIAEAQKANEAVRPYTVIKTKNGEQYHAYSIGVYINTEQQDKDLETSIKQYLNKVEEHLKYTKHLKPTIVFVHGETLKDKQLEDLVQTYSKQAEVIAKHGLEQYFSIDDSTKLYTVRGLAMLVKEKPEILENIGAYLWIDLVNMHEANMAFGQQVVDEYLKTIGKAIYKATRQKKLQTYQERPLDIIALRRYDYGDEFLVLLSCDLKNAIIPALRILESVNTASRNFFKQHIEKVLC